MAKKVGSVKITDNSSHIKGMMGQAVERALDAIGLQAEGYAKKLCPVDTGRLRNSISHAVEKDSVYIGTNVEYAPYVELGTSKPKKAARPYLKPAATEHSSEYKAIAERYMKN